jgi:hypothetical protein
VQEYGSDLPTCFCGSSVGEQTWNLRGTLELLQCVEAETMDAVETGSQYFTRTDGMAGTNMRTIMAWVFIVLGLVGMFTWGFGGLQLGVGVFMLYLGSWTKKNPLITLHEDHLEMKVAVAASRRLIRYQEISHLDQTGPNKAKLKLRDGQRIALPLAALADGRREDLLSRLRDRIGGVSGISANR